MALSSDLQAGLDDVWQACLALPTDEHTFDSLDPAARRAAHDLGVRIQDRLLSTLSQLVIGMATDGVELVSDTGVPLVLNPAAPQSSRGEAAPDEPG